MKKLFAILGFCLIVFGVIKTGLFSIPLIDKFSPEAKVNSIRNLIGPISFIITGVISVYYGLKKEKTD